jgi:hypothetical protein
VLAGEKASQKAAGAFVGSSKEAVEGAMLTGDSAVGVLSAPGALTSVDQSPAFLLGQTFVLGHRTLPPFGLAAKGARLLYSPFAEVIVGH